MKEMWEDIKEFKWVIIICVVAYCAYSLWLIDWKCTEWCGPMFNPFRHGLTCQCFEKSVGSGFDLEVKFSDFKPQK